MINDPWRSILIVFCQKMVESGVFKRNFSFRKLPLKAVKRLGDVNHAYIHVGVDSRPSGAELFFNRKTRTLW